jgi:hypothetical protein
MTESDWVAGPGDSAPPVQRDELTSIDLDTIERDLRDVESALARLADGTYFAHPDAPVPGTNAPGSAPVDMPVDLLADPVADGSGERDDTVEVDG